MRVQRERSGEGSVERAEERTRERQLLTFSTAVFIFGVAGAAVATVQPRYLESFVQRPELVGLIATIAYIVELCICVPVGAISDKAGRKKVLFASFSLSALVFIAFYINKSTLALLPLQTALVAFTTPLWVAAEAFVKDISPVERRGEFRSLFGTFANAGFLAGVLLAGILETLFGLRSPYLFAALLSFAALPLLTTLEEPVKTKSAKTTKTTSAVLRVNASLELYLLIFCTISLYFWYASKWIFGPLLLQEMGYEPFHISEWLSISIIPFLLFQIPVGKFADRRGKGELICVGLLISAVSVAPLGFSHAFAWLLAFVLFASFGNAIAEPLLEARVADIVPAEKYGSFSGIFEVAKIGGFIAGSAVSAVFIRFFGISAVFLPSFAFLFASFLAFLLFLCCVVGRASCRRN